MKKINFIILIATCVMCLLPIILGVIFYDDLPNSVAIHFDVNNNPDAYMQKEYFVYGVPVMMMLVQIFCCIVSDLSDKNPEANKKTLNVYKWIIPGITVVMYAVIIMYAMEGTLDIRKVAMIILGSIFVIMGNYLPKTVGDTHINFPKIKDEKAYTNAKRIYGYLFIIDGLLFIVSTLFNTLISVCVLGLVILQAIALMIYAILKNR